MKIKKLIISILVFFFILVVWALIFYSNLERNRDLNEVGKWHDIEIEEMTKYEPGENYKINESLELKTIENENIGLNFIVPRNWNAEIIKLGDISEIKISSADFEAGLNFPKNGCEIRVGAVYFLEKENQETKPQIIKRKLSNKELIEDFQEIIFIDNFPALKTIQYENLETGGIITVEKPLSDDNGLYFFNIYFPSDEKSKCSDSFNEFLKSISIKQASF